MLEFISTMIITAFLKIPVGWAKMTVCLFETLMAMARLIMVQNFLATTHFFQMAKRQRMALKP